MIPTAPCFMSLIKLQKGRLHLVRMIISTTLEQLVINYSGLKSVLQPQPRPSVSAVTSCSVRIMTFKVPNESSR